MKFLLVLLSIVIYNERFCEGAARLRSFGALNFRTRRMARFKGLPHFDELASDEKREVFSYEQTIVIRNTGRLDNKVRHCEIIEVYEPKKAQEVKKVIEGNLTSLLKLKVQKIDMKKMMLLLRDCDSVDESGVESKDSEPARKPDSVNAFMKGIFPGTKWCGLGDIANGYHDLGKRRNLDRCCRSHDLCPIKVLAKDERYNIKNTALYTKSHCLCDEAFYDCLKKDGAWSAKFIGNLYFFAASPKCVKGLPEKPQERMEFVKATRKW